ncbi:MAG: spore coat U domain-containing protein [Parvibaculum sp.]|uniref:Csu type fimbrial protein n=1 Tax=Parvibaculum sp. TaxID=2024848 RepID=UPI0027175389|nr:spore coat U domain-containing protein [Parvibaculum sp.]MDO8838566.1 spore coat U domain-containing protein [Parvibaculum sp.]
MYPEPGRPDRRNRLRNMLAVALLAIPAGPALADTATTTFSVTATVNHACLVSASDLNFGVYDPFSETAHDGATTLGVTCTIGTAYDVGLSAGLGAGATVAARKMTAGENTLTYSLYRNASRSQVWGVTVDTDTVPGTGTGASQTLDVYGRIPALQSVPPATYVDTITVTVWY